MRIMVVMLMAWLTGCAASNPATSNGSDYLVAETNPTRQLARTKDGDSDEICLKSAQFQVEMCYERGEPRTDPETGQIVGYDMKLTHIDANAR